MTQPDARFKQEVEAALKATGLVPDEAWHCRGGNSSFLSVFWVLYVPVVAGSDVIRV